jgi:hypothetical protein
MREESIGSFIWLGSRLRYLLDAGAGHPIHGETWAAANVQRFLEELERLGLTITLNVAKNEKLPTLLEELRATEDGSRLTNKQAEMLADAISSVKKTLRAEAEEKKAFVTSPKRWDVERLLTDPGSMFGEGVYEKLDSHAAYDFEEACKCIAFERPTAAAFHNMRGTEATLRAFYCYTVRRKRLAKEKQMWGPMLDQLKGRSIPPPKALLDNLDSIRFNFRNPTQHPDEIHTIDSAQDLLGLTIPAVNEMVALMGRS